MERYFAVHFIIRMGLGPEYKPKTIHVGFDDIDAETSDSHLREMAKAEAESQLRKTDDFPVYGVNWIYKDIEET